MDANRTVLSSALVDCFEEGCYLGVLAELYSCVRLPLSAFICTIGCFFNILNVIIFTRPKMRTPVNIFLASLSLAQFLFSLNYLILMLLEYFRALCYPFAWTYAFTVYKLVNVNVNLVLHSIAFGHILAVVAFRVRSMQPPIQLNQFLYDTNWALSTSGMVWLFVPMFCIPIYFTSTMTPSQQNHCQFETQAFEHSNVNDQLLVATVYWMYAVVLKLLPALFAMFLFLALLKLPLSSEEFRRRMRESQEKQRKISSTSSRRSTSTLATNDHPTRTLASLLVITVSVELLHGLWNLWQGLQDNLDFQPLVRGQPSKIVELCILLQHALSFLLHWYTLVQFRQTLHSVFTLRRSIEFDESVPLSKKRYADSVMLTREKRKRKLTKGEPDEEALTAKSSVISRPHGPYPTIIISNDNTRNITKLTF